MISANASILSLLTISCEESEYVFFAYLKELTELALNGEPFWYDKRGANNQAAFLWKEKKIKQWLVIGEDQSIASIFEQLVENRSFLKIVSGYPNVLFRLGHCAAHQLQNAAIQVDEYPVLTRSLLPMLYRQPAMDSAIPFLLGERNNCDFLSGYAHNSIIKSMAPAGLLPEGELFDRLNNQINAMKLRRDIYCRFSEIRNPASGDISLRGFVQMDKALRTNYRIEVTNVDGTREVGHSEIDASKGIWEIPLDNLDGAGQLRIVDKIAETIQYAERYVILRDFKISATFQDIILKDMFGREIAPSRNLKAPSLIKDHHWERGTAPDGRQAAIELNDKLVDVLCTLGQQIRIVDPYFLGPVVENNGRISVANTGQQIFLNALLVAIVQNGVTSLIIQGFHKNTGEHDGIQTTDLTTQYKLLWKLIQNTYGDSPLLKLEKLELVKTREAFHDRYWLGDGTEPVVIYSISNSASGQFKSGEWNCMPLSHIIAVKKKSLIYQQYAAAEKINLMP